LQSTLQVDNGPRPISLRRGKTEHQFRDLLRQGLEVAEGVIPRCLSSRCFYTALTLLLLDKGAQVPAVFLKHLGL
jgi:hypothetical protein